jgi:type II secretory pathway component PulK
MRARRGSSLALVLWTLVVAGGLSLAVSARARSAMAVASNARAAVASRYAAESAVELAIRIIEDCLLAAPDSALRTDFLNALGSGTQPLSLPALDGVRMEVAISDVNAKLDLNYSDAESIAQLLSEFGDAGAARRTAAAIRSRIGSGVGPGGPVTPDSPDESFPIGQIPQRGQAARYLTSLDELMTIPEVDLALVERAASHLTVDGDGMTNRVAAPPSVLRAARGALIDAPNRLLVVARGWLEGSSLTHEIQAVYAVQGSDLALVRWREQTR